MLFSWKKKNCCLLFKSAAINTTNHSTTQVSNSDRRGAVHAGGSHISAVSISCFVFASLLVFQITGEKRPSSEMMKPKPKPQKKKKKKDPNEPTKPVSAYALFFRDTQAAIKGQNPNATFGDVSKIVASMWDGLGEEQKQVPRFKDELMCTRARWRKG